VPRTDRAAKESIATNAVAERVPALLEEIQRTLYAQALAFRESRTYQAANYAEFQALLADKGKQGFVEAWWCGDAECEAQVKADTQATIRNLPIEHPEKPAGAVCVHCDKPAAEWAIFAKAY
jgi:prolyl-tRNA synthetase